MKDKNYDEDLEDDTDPNEEDLLAEDGISSEEEGFMRGYSDEEEVVTCEECGVALKDKPVSKVFNGDKHKFCSKECAEDYEDSLE